MFTTGQHGYLFAAALLYALALAATSGPGPRLARALTAMGLLIHALFLLGRGWLGGVFIANPIFEGPFLVPFCLASIALLVPSRDRSRRGAALILALLFTVFAAFYARGMVPPVPRKLSLWANLFFITESSAHALFLAGAAFAVNALWQRRGTEGFHTAVVWGFVLYSICQVAGAYWCYLGWGNTFRWSPRHLGSAAIWLAYAAYLHLRFVSGWSERRRAVFAAICCLIVLWTSFGSYLHELTLTRVGG